MKLKKGATDYFIAGCTLLNQGKLQQASNLFRKGLSLNPTYKEGWMNLGVMLKELGDYQDSEQCLKNAIQLDHNYGDAWFNLGTLYMRALGRYEKALECLKEAMRCNPEDENAVCFAAEALGCLRRFFEAGDLLDKAIQEHPNFHQAAQMREGMAAAFRQYLENIAQRKSRSDAGSVPREAAQIVVMRSSDPRLPFKFNYGASFVISLNRFVAGADLIKAELARHLAEARLLGTVVFESFGGSPPTPLKVEIGSRVPLAITQAVVQVCSEESDTPIELSVEQEDKAFGYTQRVYIGSLGRTPGVLVTSEKLRFILKPGLTQDQFTALLQK